MEKIENLLKDVDLVFFEDTPYSTGTAIEFNDVVKILEKVIKPTPTDDMIISRAKVFAVTYTGETDDMFACFELTSKDLLLLIKYAKGE